MTDMPTPVSFAAASPRPVLEGTFATHDGTELFYRHWPAAGARPRGAVLLLHRGHEHSGRVAHLADELDMPDVAIFAWDARGHGRSPGRRGFSPGVEHSVRDLQTFVDHVAATHGIPVEDMAVVAQSVGAVLAAAWAHDYAPRIRALVLASPAFQVKLYVPFARPGLALLRRLRGDFAVNSYVKARFLTRDPERRASYAADPLVTRPISVDMLLGLHAAAKRVVADARAITIPTQVLISGTDVVVRQAPQHRFYENLGSAEKERHVLKGFRHDTLGERGRGEALARVRAFLEARFAAPPHRPALLEADRAGFTRNEADRLATPLPLLSGQGLAWAVVRLGLRLGSLLSEGLRVGRRTGFDSGSTLDYVYRDEARGLGPVGRAVDRLYLDSIGWRGIRRRKAHVEELLREGMARLQAAGEPIHVLDIAAGHGRYVLDALAGATVRPASVTLRDYSDLNVEAGTTLVAERGLAGTARFVKGDAFDERSLAASDPRPTLAVVSGLYELFPDNALVARSLAGLAAAVPPGGYLVYTGQPWHPQLAFIARALTSHRGGAWIMRRRSQAEMDALVEAAGFSKVGQRIDPWGIFTVSLARRTAP